jgi:hypothetical protein
VAVQVIGVFCVPSPMLKEWRVQAPLVEEAAVESSEARSHH